MERTTSFIASDGTLRVPINSTHHQAVSDPGELLRVVARCPDDGVIEALESGDPDRWMIGVQWHPERTLNTSAASEALFLAFISAAAASSIRTRASVAEQK